MDLALAEAQELLETTNGELESHQLDASIAQAKIDDGQGQLSVLISYDANADLKALTDAVADAEEGVQAATETRDATQEELTYAEDEVEKNNLKVDDNAAYLQLSAADQAKMDAALETASALVTTQETLLETHQGLLDDAEEALTTAQEEVTAFTP